MFTNLVHRPAVPDSARAAAAVVAVFAAVSVVTGHSLAIAALVAAVVVVVWGESPHMRPIVLAAIAVGAVALVFGLVDWLAALTADGADALRAYGGVRGAGEVAAVLVGLAQLVFLGLAVFFATAVFASLPRPVRPTQEQHVREEPSPSVGKNSDEAGAGNGSSGWWRPSSS